MEENLGAFHLLQLPIYHLKEAEDQEGGDKKRKGENVQKRVNKAKLLHLEKPT